VPGSQGYHYCGYGEAIANGSALAQEGPRTILNLSPTEAQGVVQQLERWGILLKFRPADNESSSNDSWNCLTSAMEGFCVREKSFKPHCMSIYIWKDNKQEGPFAENEIREQLKSGMLDQNDLAWTEGYDQWKPLSQLLNLDLSLPSLPRGDVVYRQGRGVLWYPVK
jgi:hypothetical protein